MVRTLDDFFKDVQFIPPAGGKKTAQTVDLEATEAASIEDPLVRPGDLLAAEHLSSGGSDVSTWADYYMFHDPLDSIARIRSVDGEDILQGPQSPLANLTKAYTKKDLSAIQSASDSHLEILEQPLPEYPRHVGVTSRSEPSVLDPIEGDSMIITQQPILVEGVVYPAGTQIREEIEDKELVAINDFLKSAMKPVQESALEPPINPPEARRGEESQWEREWESNREWLQLAYDKIWAHLSTVPRDGDALDDLEYKDILNGLVRNTGIDFGVLLDIYEAATDAYLAGEEAGHIPEDIVDEYTEDHFEYDKDYFRESATAKNPVAEAAHYYEYLLQQDIESTEAWEQTLRQFPAVSEDELAEVL